MRIPLTPLLLLCLLAYLPCKATQAAATPQRLLVILLDGFRYDYLNQSGLPLPGFARLAKEGVKAGGLQPDFPSLSYPNYYSLMTGLHTESHGMTGNYMFDVTRQEPFLIGSNPEQFHAHWWDHAEPLWIAATRQNKTSHMYYWPGCEVEIRGLRPTFCRNYTGVPSLDDFRSALNQSLPLLQTGQTDIAAIYFELTDKYGHMYGPFSPEVNGVIRDLDLIVSDLMDQLSDPAMSDVNLMVFSDHGMTKVNPSHVIDISGVLNSSEVIIILEGAALISIYTMPGMEEQVYKKLEAFHPNMTVYRKSDLPERWHYKHGPYVAPLTAVADPGFFIMTALMKQRGYNVTAGTHGYDNVYTDMFGIFLAKGPAFRAGQEVQKLRTVDLYQVMCQILSVRPSPHNGTRSDVTPLLAKHQGSSSASALTLGAGVMLCSLLHGFVGVTLM
ncbi:glycerophosphocholine cholinephosphodiesterase ENPP6-like [Babylonia areolata]|uniref:glycerophosphocholine cholinephosphodiesterase ENPP6-like n=1 Tax=Babylonia areolata TaxID=304850 RepID=UPI003FCF7A05